MINENNSRERERREHELYAQAARIAALALRLRETVGEVAGCYEHHLWPDCGSREAAACSCAE